MARELTFSINGKEFSTSPTKIDRRKLYGWTENIALDDDGNECKLVSMDESGTLIIPKGGIGLGMVSENGLWVQRSQLKAVNEDGSPSELIMSSYNTQIDLLKKADIEEFMNYSIKMFYQLDTTEEFINTIGYDIYKFIYSYRDSYEGKMAFILTSEDAEKNKHLYMMVGVLNEFEMLCLNQTSIIEDEPEVEEEDDDSEIDFSMF